MVASGQDYAEHQGERQSMRYVPNASQKDADEQPEERRVTMLATEGSDTRGAMADKKSPSD